MIVYGLKTFQAMPFVILSVNKELSLHPSWCFCPYEGINRTAGDTFSLNICGAWSESEACRWTKFLAALNIPSPCSLSFLVQEHWAEIGHIYNCVFDPVYLEFIIYLWASGQHGECDCEHFGFSLLHILHAIWLFVVPNQWNETSKLRYI